MTHDDVRFSTIKEDRGWYFVEYSPPFPRHKFAILQLTVLEQRPAQAVASAMESEATHWITRYPIPLMAMAYSLDESVFPLEPARPVDHLIAWHVAEKPDIILRWELVPDNELPADALNQDNLLKIFSDVPHRTGHEIANQAARKLTQLRLGWWIVFVWAVVVPLGVAVLEWWSDLLGLAVLGYAFFKAITQFLRLTGRLKQTKREREKAAEDLKMRHHHYHCTRNPEGFERLKAENFRRESIERTLSDAATLKEQRNFKNR